MGIHEAYDNYVDALTRGDRYGASRVAMAALAAGINICDIYLDVLQPALYAVGQLWETNQLTIAQEHLATAITQAVMVELHGHAHMKPVIGRTMIAVGIGLERHEIGIRMIADLFDLEGWSVHYLGVNVPESHVIRAVTDHHPDLVAISITVGGRFEDVETLIRALRASADGRRMRIMVGGQPFNQFPEKVKSIGADCTAKNARDALRQASAALT